MGFANWPKYQDGTGTYEDGVVLNKALLDAIKADIEADFFSGALSPADAIAEVVAARGTQPTLDGRLDVCINEDGTLKNIATTVPTETLVAQLGRWTPYPILNPTFELWASNTAAGTPWDPDATEVPEGWTLDPTAAITAHGAGGGMGSRYTISVNGPGRFYQKVIPETEMAGFMEQWQTGERKVTFGMIVEKDLVGALAGRLFVDDGVTVTKGADIIHTGAFYHVSVTHMINSHAVYLRVGLEMDEVFPPDVLPLYAVAGAYLLVNDLPIPADAVPGAPPTQWPYQSGLYHTPGDGSRKIAGVTGLNHGNTAGAGQTVLWQVHDGVPADGIQYDSSPLLLHAYGATAANADANKILRLYVGTSWVELMNTNFAGGGIWTLKGRIFRPAVGGAHFYGLFTYGAGSGVAPTVTHVIAAVAGGAVNWAAATPISINGSSATANTVTLSSAVLAHEPLS